MSESTATLHPDDITELTDALAAADPRTAVLQAILSIAAERMNVIMFSASRCHVASLELERLYSSDSGAYPVGLMKSKRGTSWARHVIQNRQVFVGEGPLEMAAAFDDQDKMASLGLRSIINVPMTLPGGELGVLNFGRALERVSPADVTLARFLALAASAGFALRRD